MTLFVVLDIADSHGHQSSKAICHVHNHIAIDAILSNLFTWVVMEHFMLSNVIMHQLRLLPFNKHDDSRRSSQVMEWFLLQAAKVTLALTLSCNVAQSHSIHFSALT